MDWGRRAGSRGWIRLNLYTGHMCAHDNMDAFFLCWVILIRLPGCCLEQPCFAAIFSLHQKRTMHLLRRGLMHVFGIGGKIAVIPDTFRETDTASFCCRQYVKATINGWLASQKLIFDLRPCCDEMRLFLDSGDSWILFWCNRPHGDPLVSKYRIYGFAFTRCCFFPPFCFSQDH